MPHFLTKDQSSWLLTTHWRGPSAVRGTHQSLQQVRDTPRTPQHAPVERRWKDTRNAGSKRRRRRANLAQVPRDRQNTRTVESPLPLEALTCGFQQLFNDAL
ncbi:hypothetical protein J6590_029700 [Homalodisca vitripennis]|nr:hypothetical protein J6590_029700 [Homalodisca vitripennis]